jgi:hypothetical protein
MPVCGDLFNAGVYPPVSINRITDMEAKIKRPSPLDLISVPGPCFLLQFGLLPVWRCQSVRVSAMGITDDDNLHIAD